MSFEKKWFSSTIKREIIVIYKNIEKTGKELLGNDLQEETSNVAENKQKV